MPDPAPAQSTVAVPPPAARRVPRPSRDLFRTILGDRRLMIALVIAAASDVLSVFAEPILPLQWAVDGFTAVALAAVLGLNWGLLVALLAEAIPGLGLLPFWVLVVLWVAGTRRGVGDSPRGPAGS